MHDLFAQPFVPRFIMHSTLAKWLHSGLMRSPATRVMTGAPELQAGKSLVDFSVLQETWCNNRKMVIKCACSFEYTLLDSYTSLNRPSRRKQSRCGHTCKWAARSTGANAYGVLCEVLENSKANADLITVREAAAEMRQLLVKILNEVNMLGWPYVAHHAAGPKVGY